MGLYNFTGTKKYFCQVQGQLYCSITPLEEIIFVVYFGDNMPLFIEKFTSKKANGLMNRYQRLIILAKSFFSLR